MSMTIGRRTFIGGAAALGFAGQAAAQSTQKVFTPAPPWPPRETMMLWPSLPPGTPPGIAPSKEPVPPAARHATTLGKGHSPPLSRRVPPAAA
ncbi:hypothetical protein [Sphingomonas sp. J315]|uniref:hypothetical protein n=1 Tax=Sphingomonas sp. J315 TaxID=2898433 RepID=UPI0021AD5060|nr:hypothetical protein [Sphingomonas sp. J315]UUX99750.1 hypothetical protein LRS08_00830 [Sphingomonas sp. J315]